MLDVYILKSPLKYFVLIDLYGVTKLLPHAVKILTLKHGS